MYNYKLGNKTTAKRYKTQEGETIEKKIGRILNNKEPITDASPLYYTERKEGVKPEYDIRTDKWDIALDAMDKVSQSKLAKRQERLKEQAKVVDMKKDGGAESTQGTASKTE